MEKSEMTQAQSQKINKPSIKTTVEQLMDGDFKTDFMKFLDFLNSEKISLGWASNNTYSAKYKGKLVCSISIGNREKNRKNRLKILINSAQRDKFDGYLEGQAEEIVSLFMASIDKKCVSCGGCAPGKRFTISDKLYENVCFGGGRHSFKFTNPDAAQMENIKKLITVRKEYIAKMLALGINPGTAY